MERTKMSVEEIIKSILDNQDVVLDDDDAIEMVLERKITKNINDVHKNRFSRGDLMADRLAAFAGSWVFIGIFMGALFFWIIANLMLDKNSFDPYPFILLNLVLSCIAAIQAPVIMMSQNRQEEKDRLRAKNDYRVNLKAELLTEDAYYKIEKILANQAEMMKRLEEREGKGL